MTRVAVLAVAAILCTGGAASGAGGVTFRVNSTADKPDSKPGDGVCAAAVAKPIPARGRECTLRAAVQETNALGGTNTIVLGSASYALTIGGNDEDAAATGDLDVTDNLTITGAAASSTIVDGGGHDRVLDVRPGGSLTLSGTTVRNGDVLQYGENGGAILANGSVVLTDDAFSGNSGFIGGAVAVSSGGSLAATRTLFSGTVAQAGTIANAGVSLVLTRATVIDNVPAAVGGVYNQAGTATIIDSTFGNAGVGEVINGGKLTMTGSTVMAKGELAIENDAEMTIANSTIAGIGTDPSQLLFNRGSAVLVNDTFAGPGTPMTGNVATAAAPAVTSAVNTIFAKATSGPNCSGTIKSLGHNLDDGTTCGLKGKGDLSKTDPLLAPPGENGGPTPTEALLAGSPAVDAGDPAACPPTDQRGVKRPAGPVCDIGAYEFAVAADVGVVLTATPTQVTLGQPVTYIAKVTNKGPNPATGVKLTDTLPSGATVVSSTPSAGTCTGGATIVCMLGTLSDQASATVTIIATPGAAGTARNRVSVHAQQVDPDQTTNTAQAQTTVLAPQTSGGSTQGGSQRGSTALVAKVIALRGRRVHGRARVVVVLALNRDVTVRMTLAFRGRAIAAKSLFITGARRSLTLVARRKTPAGRYVLRAVLSESGKRSQTLSVRLRLK